MSRAEKITELICGIDAEDRGILFAQVASELARKGQHYTASLFRAIAKEAGAPHVVRGTEH